MGSGGVAAGARYGRSRYGGWPGAALAPLQHSPVARDPVSRFLEIYISSIFRPKYRFSEGAGVAERLQRMGGGVGR